MAAHSHDPYKEKFRPVDAALDAQVDDALAGLSMDELYSFDKPQPQATQTGARRGKIVTIRGDDVFVDFGGKSQGVAPFQNFEVEPVIGQEMEFFVERYDAAEGLLILNVKGGKATNVTWDTLNIGQVIEGTVTGVNKGGIEMDIKSMRAFMPSGQVDIYHVPDLNQFMGQRLTVEVTQFDRDAKNLVVSRRNVLEREKEEQKKKMLEEIDVGQIRRGTVRSIMDFGAFVDLGGLDGLLHISEMTFKRGMKPSELVKIGDVVDVKIIKFDRETGKLSLSLKQARGIDPWAEANVKYSIGSTITGRVVKIEAFGAFIEVEEGVEGLLPISEMSWKRIKSPADVVSVGDTVKLVVLSVDSAARRISFSLKQAGGDPWAKIAERYSAHMVVDGTVTRVADFGAFVEIEAGIEGLVHVSELSNQRVRTPADVVKPGEQVKVQILEIDTEQRRVALSIRQATQSLAVQSAPAAPSNQPKKPRPKLRGGLEF